eukprot:jgi/Psemu1/63861/estExt_Genemark1.C_390109
MIRFCFLLALLTGSVSAFVASTNKGTRNRLSSTKTFLFDKIFEEEDHANLESDANEDLARMANDVCLDLMRKSDDWVAACSSSKWFSQNDAGKAESYYNEIANNIATKFEKVRYSIAQTKEVLSSIASDCLIDDGYCINAVEALWTPSERKEVLMKTDIIVDFPELIDL